MVEVGGAQPDPARPSRAGRPRSSGLPMYRISYEEGKRLVDDQLAELDGIRQRSVQFLAFTGSATAFLVGTGLGQGTRGTVPIVLASLATVCSLLAIYLVVTILLALSKHGRLKADGLGVQGFTGPLDRVD